MNLRQRYKSRGARRIIRFLGFYSILSFFLLFYSTFARYTTIVENNSTVATANWQISVNNSDIVNGETLTDTIKLIPTIQTTTNNKLAPGQGGHFDIIINPEGTEVAIEYTINFDVTNLPSGIVLKTYEILEEGTSYNIQNNKIEGNVDLQGIEQLTSADSKTIRVFWEWNESSTDIPTGEEKYNIQASITVKQKIS